MAKQSLKSRRRNMLCSLFERMRRGNMYGGACHVQHISLNVSLAVLPFSNASYLSHPVASHCHTQGAKIHNSKCTLSDENIFSFVRD